MRAFPLSQLTTGMTRLRSKGGANPKALFTLKNGYLNASDSPVSRNPLRVDYELPAGTKGLMSFKGQMVVFSTLPVEIDNPKYRLEILTHPSQPDALLIDVHFAQPFMSAPYVVAQFDTNEIFHYWLQRADPWIGEHSYSIGDVVEPSVPNGYIYRARRLGNAAVPWAPSVARAVNDVVEPTTPNGFQYTVVDTVGSAPRSGLIEPTWPTEEGATVDENTDLIVPPPPAPPTTTTPPPPPLPSDVVDRYGTGTKIGGMIR